MLFNVVADWCVQKIQTLTYLLATSVGFSSVSLHAALSVLSTSRCRNQRNGLISVCLTVDTQQMKKLREEIRGKWCQSSGPGSETRIKASGAG